MTIGRSEIFKPGSAMELWMVSSLLVLVILQGTAARAPNDVSSVLAQNETILATCTADSSQTPVELAWSLGPLENTARTITILPKNPDVTATITSYLVGALPTDGQQRVVQCVIKRPDLEGEKVISYTLDSTNAAPGRRVKVCSLVLATQSPVFQWTKEEALQGEAMALALKVDEPPIKINCTYGSLEMGEKVALTLMAVVGGLGILAM
ncbi:hypothetical protein ACEWY4_015405 [Coilia grayii]|uniref:Ig-like domain-containing protein n=1 Tax=Coilia grayii TaxID=363190 RepID=A0ABD1JPR0_9TELE